MNTQELGDRQRAFLTHRSGREKKPLPEGLKSGFVEVSSVFSVAMYVCSRRDCAWYYIPDGTGVYMNVLVEFDGHKCDGAGEGDRELLVLPTSSVDDTAPLGP